MFGGIVETIGTMMAITESHECKTCLVKPHQYFNDIKIGDSVALNGTCLTVTEIIDEGFVVTLVPETRKLTNLESLSIGSHVNLERALKLHDRIGGHYVQGHIDGISTVQEISHAGSALLVKFSLDPALSKYVVSKGYITIDGMSITVLSVTANSFQVTFIPHTQENTVVKYYQINDKVNIEVDIIGKYLEKWFGGNQKCSHT